MQIHNEGVKQTRRLTTILKITLLAIFPLLTMVSCKDDDPCPEGDPAIVGAKCNDGFASNDTGSGACATHGGVDRWICDESELTSAFIHGTITIQNAQLWETWKDSGEVQLSIFPAFSLGPPAGWGEIPDNFFGPGIPGGTFALGAPVNSQDPFVIPFTPGATQFNYTIELDPGTYSALALGFRHDLITDPSKRTATLGVHWGNPTQVSHGIVLKMVIQGQTVTLFNEPAPSVIILEKGDDVQIDFTADFAFVNEWYYQ